VQGNSVPVTLTGTNLTGATAVNVSGGDITVSAINVMNPTTVTAIFAIPANAAITGRAVTVTTPFGDTTSVSFTVAAAPTLTSISPNTVTHPASGSLNLQVTLTGANLTGATGLNGLTGGVTLAAGSFAVTNSNTVRAILNIPSSVTTGIMNIGVATPKGNTNTVTFTVN